ncbi:hypothetical protein BDA96_09G121600 [Sorghum bicolor]|uniref:PHD finger protein ALFIN-LIKE n=1 Tax=Sorghum bicolor TaxID=4558 RepID=A0A921U3X7_SORBI|nr:hypothetical protein BDA96_09G121600 [Sorghum bicolor]
MRGSRYSGPAEANEVLEEEKDDATNDDNNYCASYNSCYKANTFWISCDECGKWYHGKCVNITSSEAGHKERYECPDCYYERVGWS